MEKDFSVILPEGTIRLFSVEERINNSFLSKDERAKQVMAVNSPENLHKILETNVLFETNMDGGKVKTIKPLYTYSYGGVMVVAGDNVFEKDQPSVKAFNIYDCNIDIQKEYFKQILGCILVHRSIKLPWEVDKTVKLGRSVADRKQPSS